MAQTTRRSTRTRELPPPPRTQAPGDQRADQRDFESTIGFVHDPQDLAIVQEYLENMTTHSKFSAFALRNMARAPWSAAILETQGNRVMKFGFPQEDEHQTGFAIRQKDKKANLSAAAKKEVDRLTSLLMTCGKLEAPHQKFTRARFPSFLKSVVYDSLVLDAMTFEVVPTWGQRAKDGTDMPAWFQAVDAGTIFRATPNNPYGDYDADDAHYIQIVNEQQVARWRPGELCFGVRRPRTDLRSNGYGHPELTEMTEILMGLLYGLVHNLNIFKNGGPRGILSLLGAIPERQFKAFQKQMLYAATGVKNAFRMVMINPQGEGAGVQWTPFGQPNREMEFSAWNNFLYRIMCALWQIEPGETGIYMENEGGGNRFGGSDNTDEKLRAGKMKGLDILLLFLQDCLNLFILERWNPDFELRFQGIGALTEKEQAELDKMKLESGYTLNEVRARRDLQKLPPEQGDVIMNPSWGPAMQALQGSMQPAQGPEDLGAIGGPGGAPGGAPEPPPPPDFLDRGPEGAPPPLEEAGKSVESAVQRLLRIEVTL